MSTTESGPMIPTNAEHGETTPEGQEVTSLDVNFDQIPDKILPLAPGVYDMLFLGGKVWKTDDGKWTVVTAKWQVTSEGPEKDRKFNDDIYLTDMGKTQVKRVALACGVRPGPAGINFQELSGKIAKVVVQHETFKNKQNITVTKAKVQEYVVPDGI